MRLTIEGCRCRQKRLKMRMEDLGLDVAVLGDPRHVLYLTGYWSGDMNFRAAVLDREGRCTLIAPQSDEKLAVDDYIDYEPAFLCTLRLDQATAVATHVRPLLQVGKRRWGLDKEGSSAALGELLEGAIDLSEEMALLRRAKDEDELAIMLEGIEITHSCYARAREILEPGTSELELYLELYSVAVERAGEKLPAIGNDFQCNSPGGGPRDRRCEPGELYILDLGVELHGYFADNARTFSVDRSPTESQRRAWQDLVRVFALVEQRVGPGVSCRELFEEVKELLDGSWPGSFCHHLGHGVGLYPHERPNLNPYWDQTFAEGDFFTVEPGLYEEELKGGIRLEENYLVVAGGVKKLTWFPLEL